MQLSTSNDKKILFITTKTLELNYFITWASIHIISLSYYQIESPNSININKVMRNN